MACSHATMPPRRLDAPQADDTAASTPGPRPLRDLLPGLRARDDATWRELVERYERLVYSIPRRAGLDGADREDVFQATWLALVRQIDLVRDGDALPSWIITTARRLSLRARDRKRRAPDGLGEIEPAIEEAPDGPSLPAERLERAQQVLEALATLPPRCRDLLERLFELTPPAGPPPGGAATPGAPSPGARALRDKGSGDRPPSYREVAEHLGVPVGSIGPTRQRCLGELARKLRSLREEA